MLTMFTCIMWILACLIHATFYTLLIELIDGCYGDDITLWLWVQYAMPLHITCMLLDFHVFKYLNTMLCISSIHFRNYDGPIFGKFGGLEAHFYDLILMTPSCMTFIDFKVLHVAISSYVFSKMGPSSKIGNLEHDSMLTYTMHFPCTLSYFIPLISCTSCMT